MNKLKRKTLKMPVRYLMNTVLVVVLFVLLSFMTQNVLSTYQNKVLLTVGINIILAVSLNVSTGYLGQLPLGHAGFMAVGAYTCALFTKYSSLPSGAAFAIGLALGAVMAGIFGILIGIPALRLTGDYLAILTLGFGEIIRITLNNIDDVLGFKLFYGAKGLKNIPKYSNYWNVFLCVVITCFAIHAMMKSRHGRAVLAIRDNEIAAESCGIQTTYYKVMAFAFSAAFAGLAGGLYACYLGVLDPSTFHAWLHPLRHRPDHPARGHPQLRELPHGGLLAGADPHDDLPPGRTAGQLRLLDEPHRGKGHERRTVPQKEC